MSADVSASTVLLVGVMIIRLVLTDVYQRYVRAGMGPWLLLAGVLLTLLGSVMAVRALRGSPAPDHLDGEPGLVDTDHDHHRPDGDRVGWLLLAPVLVLLLVAPPALGSFGVERTAGIRVTAGAPVWAPLPRSAVPRPMTVLEVSQRGWDRSGASLAGVTVRLTGFVSSPGAADGGSFVLARYQLACCAADAVASAVRVVGITGAAPPRDSWVSVVGTYHGSTPDGTVQIAASSVQDVATPVDPYE